MNIGEKIRRLRQRKGLSPVGLAKRLGLAPDDVLDWERGKTEPGPAACRSIAQALGVHPDELEVVYVREQLLTAREAAEMLGISTATLRRKRGRGIVPEPIVLGPRLHRWRLSDLYGAIHGAKLRKGVLDPVESRRLGLRSPVEPPELFVDGLRRLYEWKGDHAAEHLSFALTPYEEYEFAWACVFRRQELFRDPASLALMELKHQAVGADKSGHWKDERYRIDKECDRRGPQEWPPEPVRLAATGEPLRAASAVYEAAVAAGADPEGELLTHAAMLYDITGDIHAPFVPFRDLWLVRHAGTVVRLAREIRERGQFGEMPRLAEQIRRCRYAEATVLAHLREAKVHTHACWVLDNLVGRHLFIVPPECRFPGRRA